MKRLVSNLFQSPTKLVARSIIYPGSFEIYIYNELFQNISLKDWNYYKDQSAKEFFLKIQEWKLQGKGGSIEQLLSGMNTFKDSQEFEKYLKLFLMLGNNSENRNWLITAFSFFVNKGQLERQYGLNEQQIANLLEKVISDSDISYYSKSEFASFFLMQIIEKNNILFGTKEFWYKQLLSVFREFVKNSDSKANSQSYEIYWNLVDHVDPKDNHLILIPEANEIMKEYLTKVKDDFGRYIIRPYINPPDDKFTFDPWLTQVFGSLDAVITFIESIQSDSELFKIAKAYLPEYKEMKIQNKDYFIVKNKKERDRILELIQQLHAH